MKITVNDYEIEIKSRDAIIDKKYNKKDTLSFLNWLSMALNDAAIHEETLTCYAIAREMREAANKLYEICEQNGLYNNK